MPNGFWPWETSSRDRRCTPPWWNQWVRRVGKMCFVQRKENNSLAARQHPTRTIGLFSWATKPPYRPTAAWCDRPWRADVKCCKVLRYMSNTFNFVSDSSWISNQAFLSIVWRPTNRMQRKSSAQRPHCACSTLKLHCTVPQLQR